MKISTRGRYALRVMIDLAENYNGNYIPLKDIAARQEISQKYLESITAELTKNALLEGQHGKGGGYKLSKDPEGITVGDVLRITEGDLAPIACLEKDAPYCTRTQECRTLPMWRELYKLINDYFNGVSLADLMQGENAGGDYVI